MAHAGTPTDLAKQPATSTTNGLWQAFVVAIVLLALVAGMVIVGTNLASKGSAVPAADHRYDQIEAQRGATTFAGPKADRRFDELILAPAGAPFSDGSYDQAEKNRGGASSGATQGTTKVGGTAPDNGPGRILGHRGGMIDQ